VNDKGYARKANEAGGASYFVPSLIDNGPALAAALQDAVPVADVRFGPGTPFFKHLPQSGSGPPKKGKHVGMLSYIHKIKSDRNIFYFANSTDETVEVDVVLRGGLTLQSWNPGNGIITDLKSSAVKQSGMHCTRARLKLGPVQSVFFIEVSAE
jgi:hypothetical protein